VTGFRLIAAPHTPLCAGGALAPEVVPAQAAALAAGGCTGAFVGGSTGEWCSLTVAERPPMASAWAEAGPAHGLEVIVHAGHLCLADAQALAAHAGGLDGVAAVSALAPSYYRPQGMEALWDWCAEIAGAAGGKPFLYYHIPEMTGVDTDVAAFLRGGRERVPGLAGVKFTVVDPAGCAAAVAVEGMAVYYGNDESLAAGMRLGADGAVGSSYNFAAPLAQALIAAETAGMRDAADALQSLLTAMIERVAAAGYLPTAKALMTSAGVPVGPARPPVGPSAEPVDAVEDGLRQLGLVRTPGGWAAAETAA